MFCSLACHPFSHHNRPPLPRALQGLTNLSDDTVGALAYNLTCLEHLQLAGCTAVRMSNAREFAALRYLDLSFCDAIASLTMLTFEMFVSLEELKVDGCGGLTRVNLALPRLRVISLRGCRALQSVS